ncbi:hypothetical protein SGUI_0101 [Serinicoccus hydrothermalis]|uniref:AMIN-like domain-containing protein n=1 Tax=Serinicoccus hydrothermalis TaxID=1758689 RepID=A0A1B1N7U7_9MICO|nr:AMIN domain-containing protein [Serinicoccus hydrothermalis]ANS77497.1 hypothetical protein SGUI_0101 [Serinicoccus hydrothermalis]
MSEEQEVRALLEGASRVGRDERLAPDEAWGAGRRRRTRKRVGGAVGSGAATLAAAVLVWQTGFLGGGDGTDGVAAEFPRGGTTFVFAEVGSDPGADPASGSAVTPVDADELVGTGWDLQEELWRGGDSGAIVGADVPTELSFPAVGGGWGITVDGCGEATAQGSLDLEPDGAFAPQELTTTDIGCSAEVQRAEDFWMEALAGGGSVHRLGDEGSGLLLLTVVVPTTDEPIAAQTPPAQLTATEPTATTPARDAQTSPQPTAAGPLPTVPSASAEEPSTAEPEPPVADEPASPVSDPEPEPAEDPEAQEPSPAPVEEEPEPQPPIVDPGTGVDPGSGEGPDLPWTEPAVRSEGGGGVVGGGQLFAPELRAGRHEGFDRVVVDLTGTPASTGPGWVASYEGSPTRAGSGAPAGVAGDSVLQLVLGGMAYPEPGDPVYDAGDYGLDTHSLGAVVEVIRTTPFEGQLQVFVGMTGEPRAYRVFTLSDPLRLVVDIDTSSPTS